MELHASTAASGYWAASLDVGTHFGYINTQTTIPLVADVDGGPTDTTISTGGSPQVSACGNIAR